MAKIPFHSAASFKIRHLLKFVGHFRVSVFSSSEFEQTTNFLDIHVSYLCEVLYSHLSRPALASSLSATVHSSSSGHASIGNSRQIFAPFTPRSGSLAIAESLYVISMTFAPTGK